MMRILYTTASLDPSAGGPARSVPQLACAVAKMGHEVALWSPEGTNFSDGVAADEVNVYTESFEQALEMFGRPDIVHDNGLWLPCHRRIAQICQKRRIPRVVATRGMLEPWALNHKKWKKKLAWYGYQKRQLQTAIGLHATAESEAAQLRKLGLVPPIGIIPNGVDIPSVSTEDKVAEAKNLKTALFLSRIHPKKGLLLWVEAWARVRPEGWAMRVVGPDEGGHRCEVERMVKDAGLQDCWTFEDSLEGDAKWQAMRDADLFVLPSYSENFGIVVAEALAAMTPVITTTGTPWQGLVEHECGWWCEPTVDALGCALRSAVENADAFTAMGRRGCAWVEKDFGWQKIAEHMLVFYQKVLAGNS